MNSDLILNPFEINDGDYQSPLCDIDPDLCFFNEIEYQVSSTCNYFDCESFKKAHYDMKKQYYIDNLALCHLNILSLKQNLADFERYLNLLDMRFTIIGVSETWLGDCDCLLYELNGYDLIEEHRVSKRGGGVGIFVKNGMCFSKREDLCIFEEYAECVTIEIEKSFLNSDQNIIVCAIYRPPNTDTLVFNEMFSDLLDIITRENKLCYIMGDYNINLLNHDTHSATAQFMDMLYSNAFIPLINRPTRVTPSSATLIDNIFTNNLRSNEHMLQGIFVTDISDHFPVFHVNYLYQEKEVETSICKRKYSFRNKQNFCAALAEIDWSNLHTAHDAQQAFTQFQSVFLKLYEEHFPKRRIKFKYNNRRPWLTEGLKLSIRTKNKLYIASVKQKCVTNEVRYKDYRNKLNHALRSAERKSYADLIDKNKSNLKKIWCVLKVIVNKNKAKRAQEKFRLSDQSVISDRNIISTRFNDYFIDIGHNIASKIPDTGIQPKFYFKGTMVNSLFLEPVTENEIQKIILSLKNGAPGYDDVTAQILKSCVLKVQQPLSYLCNRSLTEGIFPREMKIANVLPLYKSGDPMLFNNYRPVSLLCILSKVFEKVM